MMGGPFNPSTHNNTPRPLSVVAGTGIGVAADFCSEEFVITFEPGTAGSVVCNNISINDDEICEGTEDFDLVLASGPDGGSSILNSPGMVFIIDDDGT